MHLFGEIKEGKLILNNAGKYANDCWLEIPGHFPNAVLHEYIIMPNHVHGIIELKTEWNAGPAVGAENFLPQPSKPSKPSKPSQPSQRSQPSQSSQPSPPKNKFQKMIPRSIGSIVKGFKIGVTKWFRENTDIHTVWQRNYHEHIIRNEKSYHNISSYIINNPTNWEEDKFHEFE